MRGEQYRVRQIHHAFGFVDASGESEFDGPKQRLGLPGPYDRDGSRER